MTKYIADFESSFNGETVRIKVVSYEPPHSGSFYEPPSSGELEYDIFDEDGKEVQDKVPLPEHWRLVREYWDFLADEATFYAEDEDD